MPKAAGWSVMMFALLFCISARAGELPGKKRQIVPADVLGRVKQVQARIELIRAHLGKPVTPPLEVSVIQASPREVFFQASNLFAKANQLHFELIGARQGMPAPPPADRIEPADVYHVVSLADQRLQAVAVKLGIQEGVSEVPADPATVPSDVITAILKTNRQINLLVEHEVTLDDVFERITLAMMHAASLLSTFPEAVRIPPQEPLEDGVAIEDIYERLWLCFATIQEISRTLGLETLQMDIRPGDVRPSDVLDIATVIISELHYFRTRFPERDRKFISYYPGDKVPAEVYQRSGMLQKQLDELQKFIVQDPQLLIVVHSYE